MRHMKKAFTLFAMFFILLLAGCAQVAQKQGTDKNVSGKIVDDSGGGDLARLENFEKVTFRTEDGFVIAANFTRAGKNAVVLLPQRGMDRGSYSNFAKKLVDANFTTLALDLRGHGESLDQNGLKREYGNFTEQDYRDMVKDVAAGKKYLQQQGFEIYAIVGASIGANTAVNYAGQNPSVKKIVLLSPGLNYLGIDAEKPARDVKAKALIVASEEDSYSFGSAKALARLIPGAEFMGLQRAGHGTNMFNGTLLENDVVKWLSK